MCSLSQELIRSGYYMFSTKFPANKTQPNALIKEVDMKSNKSLGPGSDISVVDISLHSRGIGESG